MKPVEIVTSKEFVQDELIPSLLQIGVERDENPDRLWDYVLSRRMGTHLRRTDLLTRIRTRSGISKSSIFLVTLGWCPMR